jgi:hypothetical protein
LELLLHSPGKFLQKETFDLYGAGTDSIGVYRRAWGFFDVIAAEAFHHTIAGEQSFAKIALLGASPDSMDKAALYLQDNNEVLFLSGVTRIMGNAYLPKLGAKPGIIDRQSYAGDQLIYGKTFQSDRYLPTIDLSRVETIFKTLDTKTENALQTLPDSLHHSFLEPSIVIRRKMITLDQIQLSGNILVIGDSLIQVKKNAQLKDVLLLAPTIVFENGVHGSTQAIATKKLTIGANCHFSYPSVLALLAFNNTSSENSLQMNSNSQIEGLVLALGVDEYPYKPKVVMESGSQVKGQVFAVADTELKGTVYGNVTASNLYANAEGRSFNNYLHHAVIDATKRSPYYVSPIFLENNRKQQIVKWLQ